MNLNELEIYKLAMELADECWPIYNQMDWPDKKIMGDQWITAIDSICANIAEANGRYHYLDRNRFYYNARGSLKEAICWTDKLFNREKINKERYDSISKKLINLDVKLNNAINATYKAKQGVG
jgi:four helix bundle protein